MTRPTYESVFGNGSGMIESGVMVNRRGLFVPESAIYPNGLPLNNDPDDAQRVLLAVVLGASQTLNEANRNNDQAGTRVTITYGEYDNIIDPPGSTNVLRRDVFSLIAYQPQVYTQFDPNMV